MSGSPELGGLPSAGDDGLHGGAMLELWSPSAVVVCLCSEMSRGVELNFWGKRDAPKQVIARHLKSPLRAPQTSKQDDHASHHAYDRP